MPPILKLMKALGLKTDEMVKVADPAAVEVITSKLSRKGAKPTEQEVYQEIARINAAMSPKVGGLGLPVRNTPMERASAMEATKAFHGTGKNFNAFDLTRAGKANGGNVEAAFTAKQPSLAVDYAPTELVPLPQYGNVYKDLDTAEKGLLSSYDDFSRQQDFVTPKPIVKDIYDLNSKMRNNKELSQIFSQDESVQNLINEYKTKERLTRSLSDDALRDKPRMHTEEFVEGANVMPLMVRDKDFFKFNANGSEWSPDLDRKIQAAIRETGDTPDGVNITNVFDSNLGKMGDTQMIFNPARIRSRFAAFDPARFGENNLLASRLLPFALPGLLAIPQEEE